MPHSPAKPHSPVKPIESFTVAPDCLRALDALPSILNEIVPLSRSHRLGLGKGIRSLWEDLTSEREHRASEYLSAPAYYSAYLRYFLPWNLLRLSSFLPAAPIELEDGSTVVDIGSGPLTFPMALYLSKPELRTKRLTIYCTDRTERILKVGLEVFESLCLRLHGALPNWKMQLQRHQFGLPLADKADLLTAANVFNEFFWKSKAPLGMRASLTARQLLGYLKDSGSVLLMEPGDPRSGSFISAIRAGLASFGAKPMAPCPHSLDCPMPGLFRSLDGPWGEAQGGSRPGDKSSVIMPKRRDKYPWCHFTIGTESAPGWLKSLSEEAGLGKEKLVFSYLLASIPDPQRQAKASPDRASAVRIISEAFTLPGHLSGRYACSDKGYSLVRYSSDRTAVSSGDLLPSLQKTIGTQGGNKPQGKNQPKPAQEPVQMDEKSGAIILSY